MIERVEGAPSREAMGPFLLGLGLPSASFLPGELDASGRVEQGGAVAWHPPGWYGSAWAAPYPGAWASMADLARFGQLLAAAARDPASPLRALTLLDGAAGQGERGHGLGPVHGLRGGAWSLEHDGGARASWPA